MEYFQQKKVLRVSMLEDWRPFSFRDAKGRWYGLPAAIIERLAKAASVSVDFVPARSYAQSLEQLRAGSVDMAGVLMLYPTESTQTAARGIVPVCHYLTSQTMLLMHKDAERAPSAVNRLADVSGRIGYTHNKKNPTVFYETMEECLDAVRSRQADIAACDFFTGSYMMRQYKSRELISIPTVVMMEFWMGVLPGTDARLASALVKTVASFPRRDFNNALVLGQMLAEKAPLDFIYSYPFEILCFGASVMFVIILCLATYTKVHVRQHQLLQGYEESYRLLADTFGEAGIEYDYLNDRLTVFGKKSNLDIDDVVDDFKDKLKNNNIRLSLTPEQFESLLHDGAAGKSFSAEFECGVKSGGWIWYKLIYTVICTTESHSRPTRLVGCLTNIDKEHAERERLLELSSNDPLTKLYNRRTGEKLVSNRLKEAGDALSGLFIMVDIDYFKNFNDERGHLCGDGVLRAFADAARECFSSDSILCRWGGDEFFFFLPEEERNGIEPLVRRIDLLREKLRCYCYQGDACPASISVGAVRAYPGCSFETLFEEADKALYLAKKNGRNRLCFADGTGAGPDAENGGGRS
ncbi:MAG: GGDEF domain-containing protein [Cloacibacillus sp.]